MSFCHNSIDSNDSKSWLWYQSKKAFDSEQTVHLKFEEDEVHDSLLDPDSPVTYSAHPHPAHSITNVHYEK